MKICSFFFFSEHSFPIVTISLKLCSVRYLIYLCVSIDKIRKRSQIFCLIDYCSKLFRIFVIVLSIVQRLVTFSATVYLITTTLFLLITLSWFFFVIS